MRVSSVASSNQNQAGRAPVVLRDLFGPRAVGLAVVAGVAALLAAWAAAAPSGDTVFQLIWGRDLVQGELPDFDAGPTPHPLWIAVGALASLLGQGADVEALSVLAYVSYAALLWGVFRLGQVVCSVAVGAVAVAVVAASPQVLGFALSAQVDIPFLALIVFAAVLEARRPRRGVAVLVLLALAGLLRPEAWLLAAIYWVYLVPALGSRARVTTALLAAAGPGIWVLADLAITHEPLHSLTSTQAGAERLGRVTGVANVPDTLSTYLGRMLKLPVLVGGLLGLVAALVLRDRRLGVPAALAVLGVAAYVGLGVAGLSQIERYVMLPAIGIAVLFAYATVGWMGSRPGAARTAWAAIGIVLLVGAVAYLPSRLQEADEVRTGAAQRSRVIEDLDRLAETADIQRAVGRCEPLTVAGYRAQPFLSYRLDRPPEEVDFPRSRLPARGLYIGAASRSVIREFLAAAIDARRTRLRPPPGFEPLTRNSSWVLYENGCAGRIRAGSDQPAATGFSAEPSFTAQGMSQPPSLR